MIGMQIEFGHDATVEELVPAVDWNTLIGKFNLGHGVLFSFVFFFWKNIREKLQQILLELGGPGCHGCIRLLSKGFFGGGY